MQIALNGATTMHADLETDIKAAHAAGYEVIEIWKSKLHAYLGHDSTESLAGLLQENGLKPWSINSIEHITFRTEQEYTVIKNECEHLSQIAAQINCPYLVVVPGKMPSGASEPSVIEGSVQVLSELGAIAEQHGVSLAFEFLGQSDCSVQTLEFATTIVETVDRANVGLVIDSFHFFAGGSSLDAIDRLDPGKVFIFHINDAEDLPRDQLTDAQRLYPGLGILPLREMKERLDQIGYDGVVSVEIFRPEYWAQDPFAVARQAKTATEEALGLGMYAAGGTW